MGIQIIDEHHEAYLAIEDAFRRGLFKRPVTLIHVDSHDDLSGTDTRMSCYDENYRKYVRGHINIGNYIAPLILRGRIDKVIYVNDADKREKQRTVGSLLGKGKVIELDIGKKIEHYFKDVRRWSFRGSTDIARLQSWADSDNCVLDIDLDYFSNNYYPQSPFRLRYTKKQKQAISEYRRSNDEFGVDLDILSLNGGKKRQRNIILNDSWPWAKLCIDHFTTYLSIRPVLIIISRSEKSGFTPKKFRNRIEKRLVSALMNPPRRVVIPPQLTPKFTEHILRKGNIWFNQLTRKQFDILKLYGKEERTILGEIGRGKSLMQILDRVLNQYDSERDEIIYRLLRAIFMLKRQYVIE